ncbi:hypothetical protein EYB25_005508 [Talaromyces marneffei]|nr:hypothetical protein EYB25_005508 [Talaromyces marneffei]
MLTPGVCIHNDPHGQVPRSNQGTLKRTTSGFWAKTSPEVLERIFDLLSTPEQICFALAGKSLYAYTLFILEAQCIKLSSTIIFGLANPRLPAGESKQGSGNPSFFRRSFHRQTEQLFGIDHSLGHHSATDITIDSMPEQDQTVLV